MPELSQPSGTSGAISPTSVSTSSVAISTSLKETITTDTSATPTINTPVGIVRIAASASSVTVTVSGMISSWVVLATVRTVDTTLKSVIAVPGSGSVVLTGNAVATGNTDIQIQVIQPN